MAFFVMIGLMWVFRKTRPATVNKVSRRMQLVSACMMAFSHGSKTPATSSVSGSVHHHELAEEVGLAKELEGRYVHWRSASP